MSKLAILAWVGEDEHGNGEVGIKRAVIDGAGYPKALAFMEGQKAREVLKCLPLLDMLQAQVNTFGKEIKLLRFVAEDPLISITPDDNAPTPEAKSAATAPDAAPEQEKVRRAEVQFMIDNPGLYACGDEKYPDAVIPILSMGGQLWSMIPDSPLALDGFLPTLTVEGPYPLRLQKGKN